MNLAGVRSEAATPYVLWASKGYSSCFFLNSGHGGNPSACSLASLSTS
jgi:hypothetical protein